MDNVSNPNSKVARDAMGYVIGYYQNDFAPVRDYVGSNSLIFDPLNYQLHPDATGLYNGNIAQIWNNLAFSNVDPNAPENRYNNIQLYTYKYDQLQRLKRQKVYQADYVVNQPPNIYPVRDYEMDLTYNPDGNILSLNRNGYLANPGGLNMDILEYSYYPNNNRLERINESVSDNAYTSDIDRATNQTGNYQYDATGNLIVDLSENITYIDWNIANKPGVIYKGGNTSMVMNFYYDASQNRIGKLANNDLQVYVRDASGNIISVYSKFTGEEKHADTVVYQNELHLYGSARLGIWAPHRSFPSVSNKLSHFKNQRNYELTNHLGNVMVSVTDHKTGVDNDNDTYVDYYEPVITSSQDYYPGGMLMPGRVYPDPATNPKPYRFGMNGQEKDDEIAGNGNIYSALYWEYDSRSLRRWNLDPKPTVGISEYSCFGGNPILFSDPFGDIFDVTNDKGQSDVNSTVAKGNEKYITYTKQDNGSYRVGLDFAGMSDKDKGTLLENDKGLALINNLVNAKITETGEDGKETTRDAMFLYNASTQFSYTDRKNGKEYSEPLITSNDPLSAIKNLSITPQFAGCKNAESQPKGWAPPKGYDGSVTIAPGSFFQFYGTKLQNVRANFVMHELSENYYRTIFKLPSYNPDGGESAHKKAFDYTKPMFPNNAGNGDGVIFKP